jgi:hypothetical protein
MKRLIAIALLVCCTGGCFVPEPAPRPFHPWHRHHEPVPRPAPPCKTTAPAEGWPAPRVVHAHP